MTYEYKVRQTTSVHPSAHQRIIDSMVELGWRLVGTGTIREKVFMYFERKDQLTHLVNIGDDGYERICDVIDRVKNDDRQLDTDDYASMILAAINGEPVEPPEDSNR